MFLFLKIKQFNFIIYISFIAIGAHINFIIFLLKRIYCNNTIIMGNGQCCTAKCDLDSKDPNTQPL